MCAAPTGFEAFRESLQVEALQEMADNFFSARRMVEEEVELLFAHIHGLRAQEERALDRLTLLHALLLEPEMVRQFYEHLTLSPTLADQMTRKLAVKRPRLFFPPPGALRFGARFMRIFELVYTFAYDACDTYMHGRYKHNPRTGSRSLSLHFAGLNQWCHSMNLRIRQINASQQPSQVLGYSRALHSDTRAENATGATLENFSGSIDESLQIPLIECSRLGLEPLPELPSPARASEVVRDCAKELLCQDKKEGGRLRELIRELESNRAAGLQALGA